MCGIVYSKSFTGKPVNATILSRYKNQRGRGIDGFGFYLPKEDRLTHNTREGRILSLLRRTKSSEILFHHRLPTSTVNVRNSCHPFSTKDYFPSNYVLVHNGVLWNEEQLYEKHYAFGIEYVSEQPNGQFNDSESLAYDVAMYLEGWQDKIESKGSIAFICIKRDKKGEPEAVYFARNFGSPLKLKLTKNSITLSSEGEGDDIVVNKMYRYDYKTGDITMEDCVIPTGYSYAQDPNYYAGMGFGYNSRPYSDFDDEFEQQIYDARTDEEVDRLVKSWDFNTSEQNRVRAVRNRLMSDNHDNPYDAVAEGDDQIKALYQEEARLEALVMADIAQEKVKEAYMMIPDQIYYLEQALILLEKEASSAKQQEFFHSPARNSQFTKSY